MSPQCRNPSNNASQRLSFRNSLPMFPQPVPASLTPDAVPIKPDPVSIEHIPVFIPRIRTGVGEVFEDGRAVCVVQKCQQNCECSSPANVFVWPLESDYYSLGLSDVTWVFLLDRYSLRQGGPTLDRLVFVRFSVRKRRGLAMFLLTLSLMQSIGWCLLMVVVVVLVLIVVFAVVIELVEFEALLCWWLW